MLATAEVLALEVLAVLTAGATVRVGGRSRRVAEAAAEAGVAAATVAGLRCEAAALAAAGTTMAAGAGATAAVSVGTVAAFYALFLYGLGIPLPHLL